MILKIEEIKNKKVADVIKNPQKTSFRGFFKMIEQKLAQMF